MKILTFLAKELNTGESLISDRANFPLQKTFPDNVVGNDSNKDSLEAER